MLYRTPILFCGVYNMKFRGLPHFRKVSGFIQHLQWLPYVLYLILKGICNLNIQEKPYHSHPRRENFRFTNLVFIKTFWVFHSLWKSFLWACEDRDRSVYQNKPVYLRGGAWVEHVYSKCIGFRHYCTYLNKVPSRRKRILKYVWLYFTFFFRFIIALSSKV